MIRAHMITFLLAAALPVPATAQAAVVNCSNTRLTTPPWAGLLLYNESARNVSCNTVHSLLRGAWVSRGGTLFWGPFQNPRQTPPGWRVDRANTHVYLRSRTSPLVGIYGGTERFTSGSRAFRVTWGRVTQWTLR